jgi:hypothetical protein
VPPQRATTRNFRAWAVWLCGSVLALDAALIDASTCLGVLIGVESWLTLCPRLPFYQDKLHEETVFRRFSEILAKVGGVVCASRCMQSARSGPEQLTCVGPFQQDVQQARDGAQGV